MSNIFSNKSLIKKAITKSQHCQRNWDLSKQIPEEDLKLLEYAATQCPSKQNVAHYKVHMITNRDVIEKIHAETNGFAYSENSNIMDDTNLKYVTNSQTLANLLVVFEDYTDLSLFDDKIRNNETVATSLNNDQNGTRSKVLHFDRNLAVGIAAGYLNLTATLLGYSTGCCSCMNQKNISKILNMNTHPLLLMGIGFKNPNKNRRVHHLNEDFVFPTKSKQSIPVIKHL